jgi:magnesium chelatase family protein
LLDRIDLRVEVPAPASDELLGEGGAQDATLTTASAAPRVRAARNLQRTRSGKLNADLAGSDLAEFCALDRHCRTLLAQARAKFELSARGVHRVLRVARTIADLESVAANADGELVNQPLGPAHLAEALQLRRAVT